MNWVTIIWTMSATVSLTLGCLHGLVWLQDRKAWPNLWFALLAVAVAVFAGFELSLLQARTATQYATLHRWGHVPMFFTVISLIGFIMSDFRSGRAWLAWTVIGLRVVILIINFTFGPTFNFRTVTGLMPFRFLGETVSVPVATAAPWSRLGEGSALLLLVFVLDASIRLWRRGNANERRRAVVVGSGVALFISLSVVNGLLIHTGAFHAPHFISLFFVLIVVAMGYELSRDVIHAGRMAEELRENSETMSLAANAAQLALWRWDIPRDVLWVSPNGRQLYGIPEGDGVNLAKFLATLHPDDREAIQQVVTRAIEGDGDFRAEYRVVLSDGRLRWIAAEGKVEFDGKHKPAFMRGVSIDITGRKDAEVESIRHRAELAHLTRVTTLNQLSGSLAHELNQPLAIILSNAQAAQRLLARNPPDVEEVREILIDIVSEDRRAGEVIQHLRALMKRGETSILPLPLNDLIAEVLRLANADLIGHGVTVTRGFATGLPPVLGDRVQLQQLVLNLILNGADAMAGNAPGMRELQITTSRSGESALVSIRDHGSGLPAETARLFEPFYTTKPQGLGMGLAICRSIVSAHQGRLWAEPHPEQGAVFHFEIPLANES